MRRATATLFATVALLGGCGVDADRPAKTAPPQTTGPVATAPVTTATAPTVTTVPELVPPTPPVRVDSRRAYLTRLLVLAERLDAAIDTAARTGESQPIADIDEQVMRTTKAWLDVKGHRPIPAAETLAAAIATARTNVESSLLAPESRRQVQAARGALAAERGTG
jgi:hypothetical protein